MRRLGSISNNEDLEINFPTRADLRGKVDKNELVFNVKDFKKPEDTADDDTPMCQAAIDAAKAAGGGVVFFPSGTYRVKSLVVNASNITLEGAGITTSIIRRHSAGVPGTPLVDISGTPPPDTTTPIGSHVINCAIKNLRLHAADLPGAVLRLFYSHMHWFERVSFWGATQSVGIHGVEFWDSRFLHCRFEFIGNKTATNDWPGVLLEARATSTIGEMGYSNDNCNQIMWYGCVWETNMGRSLVIDGRSNGATNNFNNGFYLTDCKFETSRVQGAHIEVGRGTGYVFASKLFVTSNKHPTGYTGSAIDQIIVRGTHTSWRDIHFANGSSTTQNPANSGFHFTGESDGDHYVDGVFGHYGNVSPASGAMILIDATARNTKVRASNLETWGGVDVIDNDKTSVIDGIERSPDGSRWRIQPQNDGTIKTIKII